MRFEKAGSVLYRQMARKSTDSGIKNLLGWLASQEDKHYNIIRKMKAQGIPAGGRQVNWKGVTRLFKRMKSVADSVDVPSSQVATYRRALKVEKKSVGFYASRAHAVKDPDARRVLNQLAREEKRHVVIIRNLIDFVTEPESWHEDAEFHRMGQY